MLRGRLGWAGLILILLVAFAATACVKTTGKAGYKGAGLIDSSSTADTETPTEGDAATEEPKDTSSGRATAKTGPFRILTQARGNAVRAQILDAIRNDDRLGGEQGQRFVVNWLAIQAPWGMFQGWTEDKGTPVEALFDFRDGVWRVSELERFGGTKITPGRFQSVPARVFGPASFSLDEYRKPEPADSGLQILTNARGNATRQAILDACRAEIGDMSVKWVVKWLRVKNGWAYFIGETYGTQMPVDAILRRGSRGWAVLEMQGEGDFPQSIPQKWRGDAPDDIFP